MKDHIYIAGTVAFFALMIGYVAAAARLGRGAGDGETTDDA